MINIGRSEAEVGCFQPVVVAGDAILIEQRSLLRNGGRSRGLLRQHRPLKADRCADKSQNKYYPIALQLEPLSLSTKNNVSGWQSQSTQSYFGAPDV